jgi:antigen flippase
MVVYSIARRLAGYRWSTTNLRNGALFVSAIAAVFVGFRIMRPPAAMTLGAVATVASALYSVHMLRMLAALELVPKRLSWMLRTKKDGL